MKTVKELIKTHGNIQRLHASICKFFSDMNVDTPLFINAFIRDVDRLLTNLEQNSLEEGYCIAGSFGEPIAYTKYFQSHENAIAYCENKSKEGFVFKTKKFYYQNAIVDGKECRFIVEPNNVFLLQEEIELEKEAKEMKRAEALAKLTDEDKRALGL